jgi:hypothetical protein
MHGNERRWAKWVPRTLTFEACEKDKLLTGSDYRMLSDWYLVLNHRSDYEPSRIESFRQMPEGTLQQMLPDAMLGRSSQQVYSFLQGLNGNILVELRNEATTDELIARIRELRAARN